MTVKMLIGSEALACANSPEFQSKWTTLYDGCPWATAYQHPDFVTAWYTMYHADFVPVIIFEESQRHTLAGLLTLALHANGRKLTGAGAQQAEYQGWIQSENDASVFIIKAVLEIRKFFPRAEIHFRYLPPGIPLPEPAQRGDRANVWSLRPHARPIMKAATGAMARQRNKKNHRQNYNRLKRIGTTRFERVLSTEYFIEIFDEVCLQYDFRQGASFWNTPFLNDPAKKPFYIELQKRGLLHVTVLLVNEQLAACHIGMLTAPRAVHLSITTYDPVLAAHSPGNLLLAMLGMHLAQEQIQLLDLTPGGDKYKEHFATEYDVVSELTIHGDVKRRVFNDLCTHVKARAKSRLQTMGYRTADLSASVKRIKYISLHGLPAIATWLRTRFENRYCVLRYATGGTISAVIDMRVARNCLHDLFRFDTDGSSSKYCKFLRNAMTRLERSHCVYSFTKNEKLGMSCWVRTRVEKEGASRPIPGDLSLTPAIVLFDFYVHRSVSEDGLVQCFVEHVLQDIEAIGRGASVYYEGFLNGTSRAAFERCGFIDER